MNFLRQCFLGVFCSLSTDASAQATVPLTTKALEGFWAACESKCAGDFLCLASEENYIEYYDNNGRTSYVGFKGSLGNGRSEIETDVRNYSVSNGVVSYGKLKDEEEGWTLTVSEFYGDRTVELGENKVTERCKVDNLGPVSQGLLMYMSALGGFEASPKKLTFDTSISQPQVSIPMLIFGGNDGELSSFLLSGDGSTVSADAIPAILVFAGSQIPDFSSGVDGDSSGYARSIGGEAVLFVSPEVREIERRRLFSIFAR